MKKPCFASQTRVWTVYLIASTNASAVLAAQLYRGGFSSSRPCVTANGEQRAPSSFAYALTRTPSLNDIPSGSSFVYSDRVILYSDDYRFRNKSSNQMPSATGCSTKVSGDTYAQRLDGSEWDGAYSSSHTFLPTSGAYIPSSRPAVFLLTLPRQWLRNQGSSSASLFDGYECEIIGSTRPKAFFGRYPFSSRSKAF